MSAIVSINNLHKSFGANKVLNGVSLDVQKGQMVAIIGRSGSGKSTLLRCLNGLERIDSGDINVCGHDIHHPDKLNLRELRKQVGIVFQSYNLFPHVTVERNITLALTTIKKLSSAEAKKIAHNVLTLVGLEAKKDAYPEQLSGGQQQRVAIARSLAMAPELMLFDEVTSALDPELTGEVLKVMEDLSRQGMTMVLVTHEMAFARKLADILVFMHQGKVWEVGPPDELFTHPKTAELAKFVSSDL
ncbi:amino acid ABC transporter ATP-binding protein [Herbaspirillum sp. RV1423]|uniref:amino acid ABC transporter ATP-binding protein n=1 Tax=Herbaspirillum sp. RV1423 TaxID=1443993 RepID=UPI0004BC5287|nr:amino acid ABC transporter ATP-binding protein [Herbaspirillum sp. RV1423]